jgi:translation initiation factor 2 beta subunit (eIF-2beta)/eIF-5
MSKININNKTNDPNYRYKMDKLAIALTGKGGNCHTILTNIITISQQINTSPDILVNYIGMINGCNTKNENNNYSLKGHYTNDKIQEIIYNFINFASLCQKCSIPELSPEIIGSNKDKKLIMKCSACGHNYELIGNNKGNIKIVDSMIKYYTTNNFEATKGNMVVGKLTDNFNPF